MVRAPRGSSVLGITAAAAAVVLASACRPIVLDPHAGTVDTIAELKVVPSSYQGAPSLQIRLRACDELRFRVAGDDVSLHLRPVATVVDGDGHTLFENRDSYSYAPEPGQVIDAPGNAGVDLLEVPVAGAEGPYLVAAGCTSYPGYGQGPSFEWRFATCETVDGTCAAVTDGALRYQQGGTTITTWLPA